MSMNREEALTIARRIAAQSDADELEVSIDQVREDFVRFAGDGPTQSADRDRVDVSIRVRLREGAGLREASASCTSLGEAYTSGALARALDLARVSEPNSELAPMGGAVQVSAVSAPEPAAGQGVGGKAVMVQRAMEACREHELAPAGLILSRELVRTIVNSAGREVQGATSHASFALTASSRDGAGWGGAIAADLEQVDPALVIDRAVSKAAASLKPIAVEPKSYTVVLEPAAVSSLLLFASYRGFGAQEVMEQSSFLCGREGKQLFPEDLLVIDDANNPIYPGLPFDGEGTPKQRVELISGGALQSPVTDLNTAQKLGVRCTGHSLSQPNSHGPMACNLVLGAGDKSREELLAGIERGLLITQFHYTNMIEPRDMTLTGMTRNGTFLIEKGEVTHSVKNLRFTQSLVKALENITGIGSSREVTGALFDGEIVTPWLRIEDFRFTSSSDF